MVSIPATLPHRYPFLMIDRVTDVTPGVSARGLKNVSWNEWYVTEASPFMPPMMLVEALAQLGAFAALTQEGGGLGFLSSFKNINFSGQAVPGDQVELLYEISRIRKGFVLGRGEARVGENVIVKAEEIMIYVGG